MKKVGSIQTELVYSRPTEDALASAIVPPECFAELDTQKKNLGCATQWWEDADPHTGVRRPAFTPLSSGRITLIESQGIRHGDRFVATIDINEVTRMGITQRQMWLVGAQPLSRPKVNSTLDVPDVPLRRAVVEVCYEHVDKPAYESPVLVAKFRTAVSELKELVAYDELADDNVENHLRKLLGGNAETLSWAYPDRITPDEWYFISTLYYSELTLDGQRALIRKYFPTLLVQAARRDVRNFVPNMTEYVGLRTDWISRRLCRMGSILRKRNITMSDYAQELREIERTVTPDNPMPALDKIILDHSATTGKTLSVFVRDCVGGNCFPIVSRVEKELNRHLLPVDERQLVSLALAIGGNPRQIARMFYEAGGKRP